MEHTGAKLVHLLTGRASQAFFGWLGVTRETQVAHDLVAERPVKVPEDRSTRRSLKIAELSEKMVRAIAAVNVRPLGRGPRKAR